MSFYLPIVLSVGAMLVLVFGTRKTVDTHFINADERPSYLGGPGASTGTDFERDYAKRYKTQEPIKHEDVAAEEFMREHEQYQGKDADGNDTWVKPDA